MSEAVLASRLIRAVNHVSITVSDLERSIRFYEDTLGFEVVIRQDGDSTYLSPITGYPQVGIRMAHLAMPGGIRLELFQYTYPVGRAHDPETFHPLASHICFTVENLEELHAELRGLGVQFRSEPVVVTSGANRGGLCCYMRDPDGYTLELFQLPVRPPS